MKNNHSFTSDSLEYTKSCTKKNTCSILEFKPITEHLHDKLHQEECNNQKVQKFVLVLEENLSVKNTPKLSAKYLQDKTCKTKQMQNITLTLEGINQLKAL